MLVDLLKILFCTPFLLYSCYSDIKTRRVVDQTWIVMILTGVFFIIYEYSFFGREYLLSLIFSISFIFIFLWVYEKISDYYNIRTMGGADAKLLLVLAILFPIYPVFDIFGYNFPQNIPLNFFVFSVLGNAVLIAISTPLGLAFYNIAKRNVDAQKLTYIFLGYKAKITNLANKQIWILQDFEEVNGNINIIYKRSGIENDAETMEKLTSLLDRGLIKDEVWVTPKIPFMIHITAGFFLAVFYGDLIFELTRYVMFR